MQLISEENKEDSSSHLKYPRRTKRTIRGKTFFLNPPDDERSKLMQTIKSSGTEPEKIVEKELRLNNINFTKHDLIIGKIEGKPDFFIPKYKIVIFCDGDYWHGKDFKNNKFPKTNSKFWKEKIENNVARDKYVNKSIKKNGWVVLRFWESEIKEDSRKCIKKVIEKIKSQRKKIPLKPKFTFVDLFAGIGGFRIPLEKLEGKCLGFSEIDKSAVDTYKLNFIDDNFDDEQELGDITKLNKLPFKVDLIVGGVPCQSWSVAGKMEGFDDPRGKLWGDTIRVVEKNQPRAFIFENVKGLFDPRNRKNLELIRISFEKAGYDVFPPQLLNSYDFGVPQNRDRIFIVGLRKDIKDKKRFSYPKSLNKHMTIQEVLDLPGVSSKNTIKKKFDPKDIHGEKVPKSRNRFQVEDELNDFFIFCDTRHGHTTIHSWDLKKTTNKEKQVCLGILRNRRKKRYGPADGNPLNIKDMSEFLTGIEISEIADLVEKLVLKGILRKVNNKSYELVNSKNSSGIDGIYRVFLPSSNIFSTLTATGTNDMISLFQVEGETVDEYKKNFIKNVYRKKKFRAINGREAGKLQGFPDWFAINEAEIKAKRQFGNAVSVPVIYYLMKSILDSGVI